MTKRAGWGAACVLGGVCGAAAAQAQVDVTVEYELSWIECNATAPFLPVSTPDGVIGPGEGARFAFHAILQPAPSSAVTFSPALLAGSSGAGFVGGFAWGDLDLLGTPGAAGFWAVNSGGFPPLNPHRLGLLAPFGAGGGNGLPDPQGTGLRDIQPAQFGPNYALLNSESPTPLMWRGLWVPASYEARSETFGLSNGSLGLGTSVFLRDANGMELPVYATANSDYGDPVTVPIVPAPWAVVVLGLGVVGRRRRVG